MKTRRQHAAVLVLCCTCAPHPAVVQVHDAAAPGAGSAPSVPQQPADLAEKSVQAPPLHGEAPNVVLPPARAVPQTEGPSDNATRVVGAMVRGPYAHEPENREWLRLHPRFLKRIPPPKLDPEPRGPLVIPIVPSCFYPCSERVSCERSDEASACPESLPGHDSPRMFDVDASVGRWKTQPGVCCFVEKYNCGPRQCADL